MSVSHVLSYRAPFGIGATRAKATRVSITVLLVLLISFCPTATRVMAYFTN